MQERTLLVIIGWIGAFAIGFLTSNTRMLSHESRGTEVICPSAVVPVVVVPSAAAAEQARQKAVAELDQAWKEEPTEKNKGSEGHSASWPSKPKIQQAMVRMLTGWLVRPVQICETGFNLDHSALSWLTASPMVKLVSFDLGEHFYSRWSSERMKKLYPDRFDIIFGDSVETLPAYFARNDSVVCDLAMVDGGHSHQVCTADLNNFFPKLPSGGIIMVDNTNCNQAYCVEKCWREFHKAKVIANEMIEWAMEYDHPQVSRLIYVVNQGTSGVSGGIKY